MSSLGRIGSIAIGVAAAAAIIAWALVPAALVVETGRATRGLLEVTVDQQGEVRVHDRFNVSAPVAGRLVRIELHEGDRVRQGQVVGTLLVAPLDARERERAIAARDAARGTAREADAALDKATIEAARARQEADRAARLVEQKFVSIDKLDQARTAQSAAERLVAAAQARLEAARAEVRAADAALLGAAEGSAARPIQLVAPASGAILRLIEQSERTLPAGTTVMVIGDPSRFEIVADVLSTDAVRIRPGNDVRIERWGGDKVIAAKVRLVEPYAYTKISALGVEEKRVNVWMDPSESIGPLGDGYRVEVRIVVVRREDALKIPASALFRRGESWQVFMLDDGRARVRNVIPGERNPREVEIREGLALDDVVVRYPPNQLADGMRVRVR